MENLGRLPHGMFCWAELNTRDTASARAFYTGSMGWTARDEPGPPGMPYTKFLFGEYEVAGMVGLPGQLTKAGVPSHWRSYVSVDSADETAARVAELGGEVLMGPLDAHDKGRMALVKDPAGAPFALWEAKAHTGAARYNEPGCLCWNELITPDPDKAEAFYGSLFGWTVKKSDTPAGWPYYEWWMGERAAGGMLKIQPEWGRMPAHWNVYFTVASMPEFMTKAGDLGAKVIVPPQKIEVGEFAGLQDATGAGFTAIAMAAGKADGQPPRVD